MTRGCSSRFKCVLFDVGLNEGVCLALAEVRAQFFISYLRIDF